MISDRGRLARYVANLRVFFTIHLPHPSSKYKYRLWSRTFDRQTHSGLTTQTNKKTRMKGLVVLLVIGLVAAYILGVAQSQESQALSKGPCSSCKYKNYCSLYIHTSRDVYRFS